MRSGAAAVVLGVVLTGCSQKDRASDPAPVGADAARSSTVAPVAPADGGPQTIRFALAKHEKSALKTCNDFSAEVPPGRDAGALRNLSPPKGAVRVEKTCAEAFAGDHELASCTLAKDYEASGKFVVVERHYDPGALTKDDTLKKDCATRGGQWTEAPRPAPAGSRAGDEQRGDAGSRPAGSASRTPK